MITTDMRLHPDIEVSRLDSDDSVVLKQPWSGEFFYLGPQEWQLLELLKSHRSTRTLQHQFQQRFAPARISLPEIDHFLAGLQQCGVLVSSGPGQGGVMFRRRERRSRDAWRQAPWQLLAIQLPAFNAEWLLHRLDRLAKLLFSPVAAWSVLLLWMAAAVLLVSVSDDVVERMPQMQQLLQADNLFWLAAVFVGLKICHELGHAMAARTMGADCREIGVMLLAFFPVLYCDTTDAWAVPSRWRRIVISAAGMYVELLLAGFAVFLWWFSEPGLLNSLFWNVIAVSSVTTIVFNANPLLRYDGYYMLADWMMIPNLSQQAREALWQPIGAWISGRPLRAKFDGSYAFLWIYAILSMVYRLMIVMAILLAVYKGLQAMDFQPAGDVIVGLTVTGIAAAPLLWFLRRSQDPMMRGTLGRRTLIVVSILACMSAGLFVPLPRTLRVLGTLQMAGAARLYAPVAGTLESWAAEGTYVHAGDTVVTLRDADRELHLAHLRNEVSALELQLENLRKRMYDDVSAQAAVPTVESARDELRRQVDIVQRELEELTIRAPRAGLVVYVVPAAGESAKAEPAQPPYDPTRPLLAPENRGGWVDRGTELAIVGDEHDREVVALVEQAQARQVRAGAAVAVRLEQDAYRTYAGEVSEVASDEYELDERHELYASRFASEVTARAGTHYLLRIRLVQDLPRTVGGTRATARITLSPASLWTRGKEVLYRNFRFQLVGG